MMTYERLLDGGTFRVWCLSSDDKPLAADGMTNGSQAYEMDTGAGYHYNAAEDAWIKDGTKAPVAIAITGTPETAYEGEAPTLDGLTVTATYTDNTDADVTSDAEIIGPNVLEAGENTVTVDYVENGVRVTAETKITATALALDSIEITTPPTKTEYLVGESFDKDGMVVTATYNDSNTRELGEDEYTYAPAGALTAEDDTITVTVEWREVEKTDTQAITVTEPENDA